MEILNDTPYTVLPIFFKVQPRQPMMTLLTKGLFVLKKDGVCWPAPAALQVPPSEAIYYEDDIGNSLRIDAETAPYKPRADCLLLGSGHTPGGHPAETLVVTFGVGEMSKKLWVYGDRYWMQKTDGSVRVEGPEPFTSMPIRNEFACGGFASVFNKHGVGHLDLTGSKDDGRPLHLANILDANETHVHPSDDHMPAGFGPLDPNSRPRLDYKGTYDETWLYRRKPLPPADFSFRYYNAARRDQQIEGYLRGDEALYMENLHREHRAFHSELPGIRLRYFLIKLDAAGKPSLLEAANNLDTCMVDMEEESVTLMWRGRVPIDPTGSEKYIYAYVAEEKLSEPRETAYYKKRIRALLEGSPAAPPPPPEPEAPKAELEKELVADDKKMLEEAAEMMKQADAPPEMIEIIQKQSDPIKAAEALVKYAEGLVQKLPKPPS